MHLHISGILKLECLLIAITPPSISQDSLSVSQTQNMYYLFLSQNTRQNGLSAGLFRLRV